MMPHPEHSQMHGWGYVAKFEERVTMVRRSGPELLAREGARPPTGTVWQNLQARPEMSHVIS